MQDARNIEGKIGDKNILAGSGCTQYNISIDGMQDNFENDGGMQDLNCKEPFENLTRWDLDKDSESGRMAGWSQN